MIESNRWFALLAAGPLALWGCGDDDGPTAPGPDAGMHTTSDAGGVDGGGTADDDGGTEPHEPEVTMGRLLVADGTDAVVRVIDLDDGTVHGPIAIEAAARVYADPFARYGYAVQGSANRVHIVDSGVLFESHGDHYHIAKEAPSLLSTRLDGDRPVHFVVHGEEDTPSSWYAASFNDGSGILDVIQERSLSTTEPRIVHVPSGRPHHGVGLVVAGHVLLSLPDPEDATASLPIGVTARAVATPDEVEDTFDGCPGLHGEAAGHELVAFGCSDGVLFLEVHGDHFHEIKREYPGTVPDDVRVGTLAAAHDLDVVIGNWSNEGLVVIDPHAEPHFTPIPIESPVLRFALDAHGEHLVVLTADGRLHALAPTTGEPLGEPIRVIDAFAVEPGHAQVRPTFTVGAERVFVVDPRVDEVIEVELEAWAIERRIEVGGSPGSIAIFSVSPDFGEHDGHEH